jgi:cell division septum initiation protein DivIVA
VFPLIKSIRETENKADQIVKEAEQESKRILKTAKEEAKQAADKLIDEAKSDALKTANQAKKDCIHFLFIITLILHLFFLLYAKLNRLAFYQHSSAIL